MESATRVLLLAAFAASAVAVGPGKTLDVHFPPTSPELFSVQVDGETWFTNAPVWVRANGGQVYSSSPQPGTQEQRLLREGAATSTTGKDSWGEFRRWSQRWKVVDRTFVTSVRLYADTAVFRQEFPDGLNDTASNDTNSVLSGFPAFAPQNLEAMVARPKGRVEEEGPRPTERSASRRWMAYQAWDCTTEGCMPQRGVGLSRVALGVWDNQTTSLPYGLEGSGPLAISTPSGGRTVVLSAASSFMAASQAVLPAPSAQPPSNASLQFAPVKDSYCTNSGNDYAFTANNISLDSCRAKAVALGSACFDYLPGWPRPETYCYTCRVAHPGTDATTASGQHYTAYVRSVPNTPIVLTYGLMSSISEVPVGFSVEHVLMVGAGPNAAVRHWGARLMSKYNKTNPEGKDYTTTHLGYDTGTGAPVADVQQLARCAPSQRVSHPKNTAPQTTERKRALRSAGRPVMLACMGAVPRLSVAHNRCSSCRHRDYFTPAGAPLHTRTHCNPPPRASRARDAGCTLCRYYYYNPIPNKTYEDTLYEVYEYAQREGLPYRHLQLDSWWYIKGAGKGTKSWTPAPGTFPRGIGYTVNRTGWRITAHNRMWSSDNVYAKQNGGKYKWLIEGQEAVPLEQSFWDSLMEYGKSWGLYVCE